MIALTRQIAFLYSIFRVIFLWNSMNSHQLVTLQHV